MREGMKAGGVRAPDRVDGIARGHAASECGTAGGKQKQLYSQMSRMLVMCFARVFDAAGCERVFCASASRASLAPGDLRY